MVVSPMAYGWTDNLSIKKTVCDIKVIHGFFIGFLKIKKVRKGLENGAQKKTRTSTLLTGLAPETSASTNFAIWATEKF